MESYPTHQPPRSYFANPHFVLVAAQLAVASAAIWARVGLAGGLNPVALAAWRLTIASLLLVSTLNVIARTRRNRHPERSEGSAFTLRSAPHYVGRLFIAGILLGIHFAAWFASLQSLPVGISTLLVATTPIWTGLYLQFGSRFGNKLEAPAVRFWIGLVVAFAGIHWLLPSNGSAHSALWGSIQAVIGSITIAGYLLIVQPIQPKLGSWRMVAWTYSFAALTMWPAAILMSPSSGLIPHTTGASTSIIGMALVPQLIGHTAMNWSLRHFSAALVSAVTLCEPVFAAGLAWWLLGERLTGGQVIGGAIVLVGVALAISRKRSAAERAEEMEAGGPANEFAPNNGTKSTSVD